MTIVLTHTFSQADLDTYGVLSGGDGRIHTDPDYAAQTPFGHTLVQGLLLATLMEHAVSLARPDSRAGTSLDITFVAPVAVGQKVTIVRVPDAIFEQYVASTVNGTVLAASLTTQENS